MPLVGEERVTIIRRDPGFRDRRGRYQQGPETVIENVKATVNPIPGRILATLPEGEREGDQRRMITKFELRTTDEDTGAVGDIVVYEGRRYEVRDVQVYRKVIPHLEARIRRMPPDNTPHYPADAPGLQSPLQEELG
jgi:hypothetical protein